MHNSGAAIGSGSAQLDLEMAAWMKLVFSPFSTRFELSCLTCKSSYCIVSYVSRRGSGSRLGSIIRRIRTLSSFLGRWLHRPYLKNALPGDGSSYSQAPLLMSAPCEPWMWDKQRVESLSVGRWSSSKVYRLIVRLVSRGEEGRGDRKARSKNDYRGSKTGEERQKDSSDSN